ncbi:MAG: NHL repeat-containing protein [Chloroflexia bacterium]
MSAPSLTLSPPRFAARRRLLSWLVLLGAAATVAVFSPAEVDLRPRPDLSLALLALGLVALTCGRWVAPARPLGAALLWAVIVTGVSGVPSPLGAAPGLVWAPRLAVLVVAFAGWALLLGLPSWAARALLALTGPALAVAALLWLLAPSSAPSASLYWLAADSHGTLYAGDAELGLIWVFDGSGAVRGKLRPKSAPAPGTSGPGIAPAGLGGDFSGLIAHPTPVPLHPVEHVFLICGLAVDPQDRLYVADLDQGRLIQFTPDGQVAGAWPLPPTYLPASGCLAADRVGVYLADRRGRITVYDYTGTARTTWQTGTEPLGIASAPGGRLALLMAGRVEVHDAASGRLLLSWALPVPSGPLGASYQTLLVQPDGTILVGDVGANRILRYHPDGTTLPPVGGPGRNPGQFGGVAGLASDPEGRLYVADFAYRVVQRFDPDGRVTAVWSAPQDEQSDD